MRISVMSWEQSCILTQFFKVKIRFYKLFFRNQANFTIFRVYQLINMKTSIMSWENITYLHAIFQTLIFTFTNHFLRICNFFNFLCVSSALAYEYDTQEHPKKIFKNFIKTSLMSRGTVTFVGIKQISQFFVYISSLIWHPKALEKNSQFFL